MRRLANDDRPAAPGRRRNHLTEPASPLGPGALAERLATLPVTIESCDVTLGSAVLAGYPEDAPRPTAFVALRGLGAIGEGECVAWTPAEQGRFAEAGPSLVPRGRTTIGGVHAALAGAEPYHAAAVEAGAIDLALRQAATNIFVMTRRSARPVSFCRSIGATAIAAAGGPLEAVGAAAARDPATRIKIDVEPEGWSAAVWRALAETRRVVVVDFKLRGDVREVALVHRWMPAAWIEDPPPAALDPAAAWRGRIALDGYVRSAEDLAPPPVAPGAVNVKAARVGGPLEALRIFEVCARAGWAAYVGGMFEAGPGRRQAQVLASLYSADAWNDVAPLAPQRSSRPSPLEVSAGFTGFGPPSPD